MRILALGGVFGPILFSFIVVFAALLRPQYSHFTKFISELGATGTSYAALINYGGFVPAGILIAGFGISLGRLLPRSRPTKLAALLTTIFGLGVATSGFISCDPGCPQTGGTMENFIHDKIAPISFLCLIAATAILGVHFRRLPEWRSISLYSVLTSAVALGFLVALVISLETRALTGLWQRCMLATLFLWTAAIGYRVFNGTQRVSTAG